jgi:hypothetical protein
MAYNVLAKVLGDPTEGGVSFATEVILDEGATDLGIYYWNVEGITSEDLIFDSRSGLNGVAGTSQLLDGAFRLNHLLIRDLDLGEAFRVDIYSDPSMTILVGSTGDVAISETPLGKEPLIRANSLYAILNQDTWLTAESNAVSLGGHLMTINDLDEYHWGRENIWQNVEIPLTHYFVGLNDARSEGVYEWSSGETSQWENITDLIFRQGFIAQQQFAQSSDYFLVSSNDLGFTGNWEQEYRGDLYNGKFGSLIWTDSNSTFYKSLGNSHYGIAEIPLSLSITRQGEVKEGSGVFTTSINLSAGTQASGNLAEGATVYWKVTGITADDLESGFLSGYGTITGGKLDIQHSLLQDDDTGESFEVSVFSDASMEGVYQIGTTATANIEEGIPDPLTGILDAPEKVKLRNKGKTKFILFGSDEIDVTRIDLRSLGFGNEADLVVNPSIKKNGRILASLEDENDDGIIDLRVKVDTSSLAAIIPRGTTDIRAFGQYGDGTELVFGLDVDESVLFY